MGEVYVCVIFDSVVLFDVVVLFDDGVTFDVVFVDDTLL